MKVDSPSPFSSSHTEPSHDHSHVRPERLTETTHSKTCKTLFCLLDIANSCKRHPHFTAHQNQQELKPAPGRTSATHLCSDYLQDVATISMRSSPRTRLSPTIPPDSKNGLSTMPFRCDWLVDRSTPKREPFKYHLPLLYSMVNPIGQTAWHV